MSRFAIACLLATVSAAAHAQVLVSADNEHTQIYANNADSLFALDGTNTALSFRTTKANEVVQFSFAAARCGIQQTAAATASQLNESFAQGFFYLDGALVNTADGSALTLCYHNSYPQAPYYTDWSTGQMQQRIVVPTPGLHSFGVLLQVFGSFGDGTNIAPVVGQTHAEVRK